MGRRPGIFTSSSPLGRPSVVAAVLVTLAVLPFVIADLVSDDGAEVRVEGTSVERTTTTSPGATTTVAAATSIPIDPAWLPKGMSRYGESDEDTQARIDRRRGLVAAALPTTTTTSTTVPGLTTTTGPRRTTTTRPAAPATTTPPPTTPAPTAPPVTDPPPTTAPATPVEVGAGG